MTVELWMGEEFEFGHEARALAVFLEKMVSIYGGDGDLYLVLANFIVNSSPIDLAIIKKNRIFVIELKEVGGPVSGGENGRWTFASEGQQVQEMRGGSHGNPFLQAKEYRFSLMRFLSENQEKFLKNRAGELPKWDRAIEAIVALSPAMDPASRIDIPKSLWFQVLGLDELHLTVYRNRLPGLTLFDSELHQLVDEVMHLRKIPLEKVIRTEVAALQQPVVPVAVVPEPEPIEVPVASIAECFVCKITGSQCSDTMIRGTLQGQRQDGVQQTILLNVGDNETVVVRAKDDWADKIERLIKSLPVGGGVTIAFHHLQREGEFLTADQNSLMILEPDWLINVTDLTQVEYCQRQLLLNRYIPTVSNEAMIRGNVVHQLFPAIWNNPNPMSLQAEKREAIIAQINSMAVSGTDPDGISKAVDPHIDHLSSWASRKSRKSALRSETFMLSPAVGMKGRIDSLWENDSNQPVILGELKTGKSQGTAPKPEHELQITSYALMLLARGDVAVAELTALLLYSGNQAISDDGRNIPRRVTLGIEKFQKAVGIRNELVIIDYTGNANFETNLNKCKPCKLNGDCAKLAILKEQLDPRTAVTQSWITKGPRDFSANEKRFFQHYAKLLLDELRQVKIAHARLWTTTKETREAEGKSFRISRSEPSTSENKKRLQYKFLAPNGRNTSEFRVGDSVIISGPQGPSFGRVALGSVVETTADAVEVSTNEELHFEPGWLDQYTDENLTERLFAGLYQWVAGNDHQRQLIIEDIKPSFSSQIPNLKTTLEMGKKMLNPRQRDVVEMSIRAEDYLLVLGPPGSGKTTLIEQIIRTHLDLGRRILIAAGTNRAIDEVLKKLIKTEFKDQVLRLGNEATASADLASWTLAQLMGNSDNPAEKVKQGRHELVNRRIVGATVSTLISGTYEAVMGHFDLIIVDEAAQLTAPATLGALRFADKFILIGDNNQLPAVVQSETRNLRNRGSDGLSILDSPLSQSLFDTLRSRIEANNWEGMVKLTDQYRMNKTICDIPSELWYESALKPADVKVANGRLQIPVIKKDHPLENILSIEKPVIFIDVPVDGSAGPRTNRMEAQWVSKLISNFIELGLQVNPQQAGADGQVGVISPFRAQVAQIRSVLENDNIKGLSIHAIRKCVDTVDRFQGSERDLIILSLACSSGPINDLLKDERRLNVAITRSKHKLIILGNYQSLSKDPIYYNLLKTIEEKVGYADWRVSGNL